MSSYGHTQNHLPENALCYFVNKNPFLLDICTYPTIPISQTSPTTTHILALPFRIIFLSIFIQLLRTHQRHHREYNKAIMNGFRQIFNKLCHFEISSQNGIMVLFSRPHKTITEILIILITVKLWIYYNTNKTSYSRTVLPPYYFTHSKHHVAHNSTHVSHSHMRVEVLLIQFSQLDPSSHRSSVRNQFSDNIHSVLTTSSKTSLRVQQHQNEWISTNI